MQQLDNKVFNYHWCTVQIWRDINIFRWCQETITKSDKTLWIGKNKEYNCTDASQLGSRHKQQCTESVNQNTESTGVHLCRYVQEWYMRQCVRKKRCKIIYVNESESYSENRAMERSCIISNEEWGEHRIIYKKAKACEFSM